MNLPREDPLKVSPLLASYLKGQRKPLEVQRLKDDPRRAQLYQEGQPFFEGTGADVCMPLVTGERVIGVVTLGKEITGRPFDEEDYGLLKTMAAQAASVLQKARLFQESLASREMEAFHHLSSFVLHDVKNLVSMFSLVVRNAAEHLDDPKFRRDALQTVSEAMGKMNRLIAGPLRPPPGDEASDPEG